MFLSLKADAMRRLWINTLALIICAMALYASAAAHAAQVIGEVIFAQGLASAQQSGQSPRFLSKGDALQEGDTLNTGARGFAVVALKDGTKMTLRPNTTLVLDQYSQAAGKESASLRLLKGGLRAITGAIGKANPQAVRVSTPTSTIGIRGTSFDARICEADCAKELRPGPRPKPATDPVVARVAVITGTASVLGVKGDSRPAVKGTGLFNGETLRTGKGSFVVLGFRDESKVTVAGDSEFKLEDVRFSGPKADNGNFVVRVVRGTARTLTGLLAKRDPALVKVNASTATIGIRGTGFDTRVISECAGAGKCADSAYTHVWNGSIAMDAIKQSLLVPLGRAAAYLAIQNRLMLLDEVPAFFTAETAPRPDMVEVDFNALFGAINLEGAPAGVYLSVRDGHIEFSGSKAGIDLARGEAGYLSNDRDTPVRLTSVPQFMADDPIPAPENFDEKTLRLLETLGDSSGGLICEM